MKHVTEQEVITTAALVGMLEVLKTLQEYITTLEKSASSRLRAIEEGVEETYD